MDHGSRRTYQYGGCRCPQCRQGNARYSRERRRALARGRSLGGAYVSARLTWRRIRSLLVEGFTRAELARRFGYQSHELQFGAARVRLATEQRVEAFYRSVMAEGDDV